MDCSCGRRERGAGEGGSEEAGSTSLLARVAQHDQAAQDGGDGDQLANGIGQVVAQLVQVQRVLHLHELLEYQQVLRREDRASAWGPERG